MKDVIEERLREHLADATRIRLIDRSRIVGDLDPTICVERAVRRLWKAITSAHGVDRAYSVAMEGFAIVDATILIRTSTTAEDAFDRLDGHVLSRTVDSSHEASIAWTMPTMDMHAQRMAGIADCNGRTPTMRIAHETPKGPMKFMKSSWDDDEAASDVPARIGGRRLLIRIARTHEPAKTIGTTRVTKVSSMERYREIMRFVKANRMGPAKNGDERLVLVGSIEHESSTSIVVAGTKEVHARLIMACGQTCFRVSEYSAEDLHLLDRRNIHRIMSSDGGTSGPAVVKRGHGSVQTNRCEDQTLAARVGLRPVQSAIDLLWTLALRIAAHFGIAREVRTPIRASELRSPVLEGAGEGSIWSELHTVLEDHSDRIETARLRCDAFERITDRWGDASSAEISATLSNVVSRMHQEIHDISRWASVEETRSNAIGTLETLERIALRAEEERTRIAATLLDRAASTRRYAESKLGDRGAEMLSIDSERAN